jgi:hypothetical protein
MTAESSVNVRDESPPEPAVVRLAHWLGGVLLGLLWIAGPFVVWRRLADAMERSLSPSSLFVTGLVLAAIAAAAHGLRRWARPSADQEGRLSRVLTSVSLGLLGVAVTASGENLAALAIFWTLLIVEEGWAWDWGRHAAEPPTCRECLDVQPKQAPIVESKIQHRRVQGEPADGTLADEGPADETPQGLTAEGDVEEDVEEASFDDEEELAEPEADVLQQCTLRREKDGSQRLCGWLRMPVEVGQRTGNLHVAFCPPFEKTPQIDVEQYSGPSCRVKVGQVLPYGVRLEVKLDELAEESDSILLRFSAG